MEFSQEIIINKPLTKVIELFDSFENLKEWMPDLESYQHLEGISGQPGAKTRLVYQMGKRRLEMIETILERNLPESFVGQYETKGVLNKIQNSFSAIDDDSSRWVTHNEFIFSGFMMKLMSLFMGKAIKKQSYTFMENFKQFVEKQP